MVITELYIRKFGRLSDRHFYLGRGLQIISGDNEFGKTTLHAFIRAMLFGLDRGRGRAAANDDFTRYEPWDEPGVYGGVMRFTCGGRRFRLERDFARYTRRASLVCEDDGEELSVEDGDLEMLLGGMTPGVFDSTVSVGQLKSEPGKELAGALADYAANYYETGGGAYNMSGALQILNGKRRETERELRTETDAEDEVRTDLQREIRYLERDMQRLEAEYKEKKERLDGGQAEKKEAREKRGTGKRHGKRQGIRSALPGILAVLAGAVLAGAGAVPGFPFPAGKEIREAVLLAGITLLLAGAIILFRKIWAVRSAGRVDEIPGSAAVPAEDGEENRSRLAGELTHIRAEYRDRELRRGNLREQYEETGKSERRCRLEERCRALALAEEQLKEAAKLSGDGMERRISGRMSEIFARITDGRYRSVEAGRSKNGFRITVWDGQRRIPAERLSRGTLEQIYFALRMAAADVLLEEPFPVILDDVFAFYDDKRLESVLQWLGSGREQVILLTCQRREERILNGNNSCGKEEFQNEDKFA